MHRATRRFVIAALTVASATLGAQAQSAPIKPGLWEIHSEREINGKKPQDASDRMKNMSPEKRAQFEAMMKAHGVATDSSGKSQVCYTKENLDQSAWASQAMDCKATFSSRTANFWKWHTSCPQMGVEADGEAHFPKFRELHREVSVSDKARRQDAQFEYDDDRQMAGLRLWQPEAAGGTTLAARHSYQDRSKIGWFRGAKVSCSLTWRPVGECNRLLMPVDLS